MNVYEVDSCKETVRNDFKKLTCDQAFFSFFRAKVGEKRGAGKNAERKRKIRLIYLFAESSAAPQLTNLSTAMSERHRLDMSQSDFTGNHARLEHAVGDLAGNYAKAASGVCCNKMFCFWFPIGRNAS